MGGGYGESEAGVSGGVRRVRGRLPPRAAAIAFRRQRNFVYSECLFLCQEVYDPSTNMAKAPFLVPSVFVGCPYSGKFKFAEFKSTLGRLPFVCYYADTHLKTKQLLSVLTTYIKAVDFCLFDLSFWNPNVALELGLAEGLGRDYYILVNHKQSRDVPSDIKGLQRIEYGAVKGYGEGDLLPLLARYLVKGQTHPRRIWDKLSAPNRDKKFYFALSVLSHFRDNERFKPEDLSRLSKGLWLRNEVEEEVLDILQAEGLISSPRTKHGAKLLKRLYPPPLQLD